MMCKDYRARNVNNDVGDHVEFLRKSDDVRPLRSAIRPRYRFYHGPIPPFGGGRDRRRGAGASENPHNQIFTIAVLLGLVGAALLLAMWTAHYLYSAPRALPRG